jgi:hypothetical protein
MFNRFASYYISQIIFISFILIKKKIEKYIIETFDTYITNIQWNIQKNN